jgi:hypothetical protein
MAAVDDSPERYILAINAITLPRVSMATGGDRGTSRPQTGSEEKGIATRRRALSHKRRVSGPFRELSLLRGC